FYFQSILASCAQSRDLARGRLIHEWISSSSDLRHDGALLNILLQMYARFGELALARAAFDAMEAPDLLSWKIIIGCYAQRGHLEEARFLFDSMPQYDVGFLPDEFAIASAMAACSRIGLVGAGRSYLALMEEDYGVKPSLEHYSAMADVFGRAGQLGFAEELVRSMPFEPSSSAW
ncbi:hypothetical protein SELMODRAFT_71944, partial [Selaginella moellendorffii]